MDISFLKKKNFLIAIGGIFYTLILISYLSGNRFLHREDNEFINNVQKEIISANVMLPFISIEENAIAASSGFSGVIFKREGNTYYILTALHALWKLDLTHASIKAQTYEFPSWEFEMRKKDLGIKEYYNQLSEVSVEYYNEFYDLAILSFESEEDYAILPIADVSPKHNEWVATMSNPQKMGQNTVTTGRITSRKPIPFGDEAGKTQYPVIAYSAKVAPGSSGGALINKDVGLVGIILGGSENIFGQFISGKAMPSHYILEFLNEWMEQHKN